ncbi:MAG: NADH-quinone oxidoreductase subunit I [Deltaproteobacteria bacterium]|nr:NADH-quinone oxidoreductase subunit I [Deltaproteobacteria bacterium]
MAIRVRKQVEFSFYEKSYLPEVARGVFVTLSHFFHNLFGRRATRPLQTLRYPYERRVYPQRFRGQHRLLAREDGSPRCVACYMCATACPAYCIHIVAAESPDPKIEKYPAAFEIDMLRCIYCGFCVEACPEDAIRMDTGIHTPAFLRREDAVVGRVDLMSLSGQAGTPPAFGAQNYREKKPAGA